MLPKRRRLRSAQVQEVLKNGRPFRMSLLSAKFLAGKEPLAVSVVVSKKVAKQAVDRNRLRRAVYRALPPLSGTGTAIVFVQKIPDGPLAPAFSSELMVLLQKFS